MIHVNLTPTSPLSLLEREILNAQVKIETWFRSEWHQTPPPFYASVDLRNAEFKLAPVDTNLFPAGFNNLNPDLLPLAIQAAQEWMPGCQRILIIPESHTRNLFYFKSLKVLSDILIKAGFDTRIGFLQSDQETLQDTSLEILNKEILVSIERKENRLEAKGFSPCLILLNNDLSSGIPEILENLEQPVIPAPHLGWSQRLKSQHFKYYQEVAAEFSKLLNIDPWFLAPLFKTCRNIDFMKREGEACLADEVESLLKEIAKQYQKHDLTQAPFVVIKADAGTYGMGVMSVKSSDEIKNLNRKKRTQMSTAKGNRPITQVIIQEGIYTFETWEDAVAEPVVYMMGPYVIGGFYRVHRGRGITDNLNSPGMEFAPLSFDKACNNPDQSCAELSNDSNRFYVYGVVARLALLAAAREQAEVP